MRFEQEFVDRIRHSASIVDVVGQHVNLKARGRDFWGLCPFHSEKTPSFKVSNQMGIFKCFGCGEGGDVFKFVMLMENLGYPDAIRYLAESMGIALPSQSQARPVETERDNLFKLMEASCRFFQDCLLRGSEGHTALKYLTERGIDSETVEIFGIGYAPASSRVVEFLKSTEFSESEALLAGLLRQSENGETYSRFRNRVLFPIRDQSGRTIAFGGRVLGSALPKYLNSPETPIYQKGENLFALDVTRRNIRRQDYAILVEGYFDCVVPYQFGVQNIVASLGTSLTRDQIRLLGRFTRNVLINFDPDLAGSNATLRSIELFLEEGFHVNVVRLPDGQDPDSYIRKQGTGSYLSRLKQSDRYLDYALETFLDEESQPISPRGKRNVVTKIGPLLKKMPDRIERAESVSRVANRLDLPTELLLGELRKLGGQRSLMQPEATLSSLTRVQLMEQVLLRAVLDRDLAGQILPKLQSELFDGLPTESIFLKVMDLWKRKEEISVLTLRKLYEGCDELQILDDVALAENLRESSESEALAAVEALRRKQLIRQNRTIQKRLEQAEQEGAKPAEIAGLLREKEALQKKLRT